MNDSKQPKPIKTSELILRQIHNVRRCFSEFEQDAIEFAGSKNTFERDEALAGTRVIAGCYYDEETGAKVILSNDTARKYYVKDCALNSSQAMNLAKEKRDASSKKVDVEISVLSALKQFAENETYDDSLLARYDILGEEENE